MLPFLKNKKEGGMSGPIEVIERKPDEPESFEMLDAIVSDILESVHSRDKKLLKGALEALIEHIKDEDEIQDHEEFET